MFFLKDPAPANYVISSPLEGVLMKNGSVLANTKIIRRVRWNDNEQGIEEEFSTDDKGYFKLPKFEKELKMGALATFVGKTDLWAVLENGERDQFWFSSKMEKEENSEFEEVPEGMVCDLATEEGGVNLSHGLCLTKCRWNNMPEEEDPNAL